MTIESSTPNGRLNLTENPMTAPTAKTDVHVAVVKTAVGGVPIYGPTTYTIINQRTGREVDRVEGFTAALAAQAKWNAYFAKNGV